MGDLSLLLFYFSLVTFVFFNVLISTDFYLCVKAGIIWYVLFVVGVGLAKMFVSTEIHPKPMSSTQGIKSLKALVISIKG